MKILTVIFAVIFSVIIISGCASVLTHGGFSDVQKRVESRTQLRVYWQQGTPEDDKVQEAIHSMLNEKLTVDAAVQIALLNNPSLQAKYEELGIAQADLVQAALPKNPVFASSFRFPEGGGKTNTEFSVEQDLLDLVLIPFRKKLATEQFEQAKIRVGDAVLTFAAEVRSEYYRLQGQQQILSTHQRFMQASEAASKLAKRQYEAGNNSPLDLAYHRAGFYVAKLQLLQSEVELQAQRERLSRLMGPSASKTDWQIADDLPQLPQTDHAVEELEGLAMSQRLDLAAARQEIRVLERALTIAKLGVIPTVKIGIGTEQEPGGVRLTGPSLQFELPIFNRGQAERARVEARLLQSQKSLEVIEQDARSEVRLVRGRLLAARKSVEYYRDTVMPLYEEIVNLSQKEYNFMLLGVYTLLKNKQDEINVRRKDIEVLTDYWVARSDLERAVGGRLPQN